MNLKYSEVFVFHKYNRSPNGLIDNGGADSDKIIKKYEYGDDVKNIDNKMSAKNGQIYISTRKSDYKPNIYIYLDQNYNRNYKKEYTYAKIEEIKKYFDNLWIDVRVYEFGDLSEVSEYKSNIGAIMDHIRNREVDLPVIIISDWLALGHKVLGDLDYIYSLTDVFLFRVSLPIWGSDHHDFYLNNNLNNNQNDKIQILDL